MTEIQVSEPGATAPKLLSVEEAAEVLRVCTATVYSMVERGELEHVRVSNAIRIVVRPAWGARAEGASTLRADWIASRGRGRV